MEDSIPDLPDAIYVDPRSLTVSFSAGNGLVEFLVKKKKPKKHHPHYKTDGDIEMMKALSKNGYSQKQIAQELGFQTRTVRKFLGKVYGKGN